MVHVQESPCFTLEEQIHRFLINTHAAFDPPTVTTANLHLLKALHISQELSDEDCRLLTSALPTLPHLTNLLLDVSGVSPAESEAYDTACIDGGGVAETLAAALSSMHWLRRLALRWPMHLSLIHI